MPTLPLDLRLPPKQAMHGGSEIAVRLYSPLTVLVGPNGAGKTEALRSLRNQLRQLPAMTSDQKVVVYLASGRSSAFEDFRSLSSGPHHQSGAPAAVGHQQLAPSWWQIEGVPGMYLRLKDRPDLLLKVEARLQALYERRLRLEWTQNGLQVGFLPTTGGALYFANAEASDLLQIVSLLAAVYDDQISALLIDEPEISLHPQLQAFLLREMMTFAGDPAEGKKIIIIATHSSGMLPLQSIQDIPRLIFFSDRQAAPIQIPEASGVLANLKLAALVGRLSESHKHAFFARNVLLVEGPSDEIIVSGLSLRLDHPMLGANAQIAPIIGKGQFPQSISLFRMMGKRVFVLADLDALTDDNQLVCAFREQAQEAANARGMGSINEIDQAIRSDLALLIDRRWSDLSRLAEGHRYWKNRSIKDLDEEKKSRRRAGLAALLSCKLTELDNFNDNTELKSIRRRCEALLDLLSSAGCIFLRGGTIEDYFEHSGDASSSGKPEAAASEVEHFMNEPIELVRERYADVIRAMEVAAPVKRIDENYFLREQLGSLLGAAMQIVTLKMPDAELNARVVANFHSSAPVFQFSNQSTIEGTRTIRRVQVRITSPLFVRKSFPFVFDETENQAAVIESKLPNNESANSQLGEKAAMGTPSR